MPVSGDARMPRPASPAHRSPWVARAGPHSALLSMSFLLPAAIAKHFSGGGGGGKQTESNKRAAGGGTAKPAARKAAGNAARVFTAEEVAAHASESDCYTVVEGKVYDVTRYLRLHPGGFKLLFKNAGGDSTSDFLALRHSAKSRLILEQYYVGELVQPQQRRLGVPGGQATAAAGARAAASTASGSSSHIAYDSSMPPPPAVPRKVGSMVGPQQYLSVAPMPPASVTPSPTAMAGVYPPPRPNALHSSTSHPDRLSAYTTQKQQQLQSASSIPIVSSSALSINLQPPAVAAPPPPPRAKPRSPCPVRSPTSLALEKHLSSEKPYVTPPSDAEEMHDDDRALAKQFPSFQTQPALPHTAAASSNAAAFSTASVTVSPAPSSVVTSISAFGPRRFVLRRREQQTARDVQLLVFEPWFSDSAAEHPASSSSSASAASASVAASSSSAATAVAAHPSALDPAFWLHVPPGLHISIGLTLASGQYEKRPYTPTANSQGCFELLVKAYAAGVVSRALHALPLGSAVDVFGPAGRFDYESEVRARRHWIMIAQGTGITPFYQIIKHVRAEAATPVASGGAADSTSDDSAAAARDLRLYLLDCNREESDVLLQRELTTLESESKGQLVVQHVLSHPSGSVARPHFAGRLNAEILRQFLAPLPFLPNAQSNTAAASSSTTAGPALAVASSPSPYLFLLCGSEAFHADVAEMLQRTQGIREQDIFMF